MRIFLIVFYVTFKTQCFKVEYLTGVKATHNSNLFTELYRSYIIFYDKDMKELKNSEKQLTFLTNLKRYLNNFEHPFIVLNVFADEDYQEFSE